MKYDDALDYSNSLSNPDQDEVDAIDDFLVQLDEKIDDLDEEMMGCPE